MTVRVPASLRELRAQLEQRDALGASSRSISAGTMPALGSGLRSPISAPQSNVSSRVDHGSRALHERVVALEQSQSARLAALQQKLRILRAQVATAAQTASDIQVELGSKLARLSDRVVALEKQAHAASSSSSSHRH
ncbi:hypothetical protein PPTG_21265 [Phytophthora nicotianae INRA-310]|uniref:Uncharacterized protein n=1 Tax=Phytophthora nicotianae (strain INRA-310) TaxID=761204 RepID=W2R4F1_PHYN3|nr:hypothetical protein PPTG_21265 [Phytophthora nicotianae INRA-310]ETN20253.1 hypothetical protein PPTG_21265 [Phytophthora nicotianae INRA-310]